MPDLTLTLFKEYFIIGETVVVPFKSIVYINDITHEIYLNRTDELGAISLTVLTESDKNKLIKAFTTWLSKNGE